jgi:hypothetical protein
MVKSHYDLCGEVLQQQTRYYQVDSSLEKRGNHKQRVPESVRLLKGGNVCFLVPFFYHYPAFTRYTSFLARTLYQPELSSKEPEKMPTEGPSCWNLLTRRAKVRT